MRYFSLFSSVVFQQICYFSRTLSTLIYNSFMSQSIASYFAAPTIPNILGFCPNLRGIAFTGLTALTFSTKLPQAFSPVNPEMPPTDLLTSLCLAFDA